jgi:hypothetical protein
MHFSGWDYDDLETYFAAFDSVGLLVERLIEPVPWPCPVKWCKRGRRHPRVVRLVHAASVIAGTPSVSMVV